jgi:hypothetical protein
MIFGKKKFYCTKIYFDFCTKFCLKYLSRREELRGILSQMYIGLHVKYQLFLSDFNENLNFLKGFSKKFPNMNFHENPSSGIRFVPSDRQTDKYNETINLLMQLCDYANKY